MTAAHTHLLLVGDDTVEADVWATYLALASRGGPLAGDDCREQRDRLAAELPPDGLLAGLLRSGRPIRVAGAVGGWRVEEADAPGEKKSRIAS